MLLNYCPVETVGGVDVTAAHRGDGGDPVQDAPLSLCAPLG